MQQKTATQFDWKFQRVGLISDNIEIFDGQDGSFFQKDSNHAMSDSLLGANGDGKNNQNVAKGDLDDTAGDPATIIQCDAAPATFADLSTTEQPKSNVNIAQHDDPPTDPLACEPKQQLIGNVDSDGEKRSGKRLKLNDHDQVLNCDAELRSVATRDSANTARTTKAQAKTVTMHEVSSDGDNDDDDDVEEITPKPTATLAATRSRRSTAGNRLALNIAKEREAIDVDERGGTWLNEVDNGDDADDDFAVDVEDNHKSTSARKSRAVRSGGVGGKKSVVDTQQLLHVEYSDEEDDEDYVGDGGARSSGSEDDAEKNSEDDVDDDLSGGEDDDADSNVSDSAEQEQQQEGMEDDGLESRNSIQIVGEKNFAQRLKPSSSSKAINERKTFQLKAALLDADDVIRLSKQFVKKLFALHDSKGNISIKDSCAVCFHDYCDEDNDLVACDRCGLTVHETCYGISDPTASPRERSPVLSLTAKNSTVANKLQLEKAVASAVKADEGAASGNVPVDTPMNTVATDNSTSGRGEVSTDDDAMSVQSNYSTVPWFCDPCLAGVDNMHCVACAATEGAFKETDTGKWIHMICATQMHCQYYDDSNYRFASVDRLCAALGTGGSTRACFACRDNFEANMGQTFQCQSGLCTRYLHATCAFRLGCTVDEYATNTANGGTLHVAQIVYCPEHVGEQTRRKRQQDYLVCMAKFEFRRERMLLARQKHQKRQQSIEFNKNGADASLSFWNEDELEGGSGMSDELRARNGLFFTGARDRYLAQRAEAQQEQSKQSGKDNSSAAAAAAIPFQACGEFVRAMQARAIQLGFNPRPIMDPSADTLSAYRFDRMSASFSAEFVAHVRQRDLKLNALDDAIAQTVLKSKTLCDTQQALFERRKRIELECRQLSGVEAAVGIDDSDDEEDRKKQTQLQMGQCRTMHSLARAGASDIRRVMQLLSRLSTKFMTVEQRAAIDRAHREMLGSEAPMTTTGSLELTLKSAHQPEEDDDAGEVRTAGPMVARNIASSGARRRGRARRDEGDADNSPSSSKLQPSTSAASMRRAEPGTLEGTAICVHCSRLGQVNRDMVECAECHVCYHKSCLSGERDMPKGGTGWKGFQFICKECDESSDGTNEDDDDDADEKAPDRQRKPVAKNKKQSTLKKYQDTSKALGAGQRKRLPKGIANSNDAVGIARKVDATVKNAPPTKTPAAVITRKITIVVPKIKPELATTSGANLVAVASSSGGAGKRQRGSSARTSSVIMLQPNDKSQQPGSTASSLAAAFFPARPQSAASCNSAAVSNGAWQAASQRSGVTQVVSSARGGLAPPSVIMTVSKTAAGAAANTSNQSFIISRPAKVNDAESSNASGGSRLFGESRFLNYQQAVLVNGNGGMSSAVNNTTRNNTRAVDKNDAGGSLKMVIIKAPSPDLNSCRISAGPTKTGNFLTFSNARQSVTPLRVMIPPATASESAINGNDGNSASAVAARGHIVRGRGSTGGRGQQRGSRRGRGGRAA